MVTKELYHNGLVITYPEGDISLERLPQDIKDDIEDKIHTVSESDNLTFISNKYYKQSNLWHIIAEKNNLDDIFNLVIGSNLVIPNKKKL
jgi:nucleoid-associated protein YgaU